MASNCVLMTCLIPTQLCGGEQTKRKSFDFLLLVHSQLCGGRPTKRKLFNFLLLVYSQLGGGRQTKRKSFAFLLLAHSPKNSICLSLLVLCSLFWFESIPVKFWNFKGFKFWDLIAQISLTTTLCFGLIK